MQTLLFVLVSWISVNFGLSTTADQPRVTFATPAEMAELRQYRLASPARPELSVNTGEGHPVHALYDDLGRTIYLSQDWTPTAAADVSILVHELVHHLQNAAGLEYDCPEAREKLAYQAQARWLSLFDQTLAGEFQIDPMTILVRTNCLQ